MSTPLAPGEIWSTKIHCYTASQLSINTIHWKVVATTGTSATDLQLADAVDAAVAAPYKVLLANAATYYGVKAVRYSPKATAIPQYVDANAGVGVAGANILPTQVCGLARLYTQTIGRVGRGRFYVPFPDASFVTAEEPNAAYRAAVTNLTTAILGITVIGAGGNVASIQWVIAGKKNFGTGYPVTTLISGTKWATQRRRGDYGRINLVPPW